MPIFLVGLRALIAYWGISEISRRRYSFIARVSEIGSGLPSRVDLAAQLFHTALEEDQGVAERRLAAPRFAGKPHDLAIFYPKTYAVYRPYIPAKSAVGDPEVIDFEAHMSLNLGLKTSSRPTLAMYSAATMIVIAALVV